MYDGKHRTVVFTLQIEFKISLGLTAILYISQCLKRCLHYLNADKLPSNTNFPTSNTNSVPNLQDALIISTI